MSPGQLIRARRERQGLTRSALAFRASLEEDALAGIESDAPEADQALLERLLLAIAGEEPLYRAGALVGAAPIPLDPDERRAAAARSTPPPRPADTPDWARVVGRLVRAARERQGLSLAALAFRTCMTHAQLRAIEAGEGAVAVAPELLEKLLLASGGQKPLYRDGVLVAAGPIATEWDERHVAENLRRGPAACLAEAFAWNRFCDQLRRAGLEQARQRGEIE